MQSGPPQETSAIWDPRPAEREFLVSHLWPFHRESPESSTAMQVDVVPQET